MRYLLLVTAMFFGTVAPLSSAYAHFGLAGDDEIGHGLFIGYCVLLIGLVTFIIYRKWIRSTENPEQRDLKRNLRELQRAQTSCKTQLQNAIDYPNECGLSDAERKEREQSITLMQHQIEEAEAHLAAA